MKEKRVIQVVIKKFKNYFNIKKITLREAARRILLYACIVIFVYSSYVIVAKWYNDYVTEVGYINIRPDQPAQNTVNNNPFDSQQEENPSAFQIPDNNKEIVSKYTEIVQNGPKDKLADSGKIINSKYLNYLDTNSDVIGYINIPDTNIDYPVLQYRLDNEYYLKHTIDLKQMTAASIFMDYRNRPYSEDQNTIIYGHNMNNGSMFRTLHNYSDKTFAMSHTYVTFNTIYEEMVWEVFASYKTNISFNYIQTYFANDAEYLKFLQECKSKSAFKYNASPTEKDRILTLSTCDSNSNYRFVVQAKLISRTKK